MAHVLACPRHPVSGVMNLLPVKWIEQLEQDQTIPSCCRHPENHLIVAYYSNEQERWRDRNPDTDLPNPPDIYHFICTAVHPPNIDEHTGQDTSRPNNEKWHVKFCVGGGDERPYWEVR